MIYLFTGREGYGKGIVAGKIIDEALQLLKGKAEVVILDDITEQAIVNEVHDALR